MFRNDAPVPFVFQIVHGTTCIRLGEHIPILILGIGGLPSGGSCQTTETVINVVGGIPVSIGFRNLVTQQVVGDG